MAALLVVALGASSEARAEETSSTRSPRVHVAAGAAHALGTPQGREFGAGGGGSAAVELPIASVVGAQATVGGLALAKGDAPENADIARTSTGTAAFGTLGVRLRAWGARRPGGPWMDANAGLAGTGNLARPVVSANLGWQVRVAKDSRWDAGPFLGYTQIVQPEGDLRSNDARVLWAGISLSFGAPQRAPAEPLSIEPPPPPPPEPPRDRDGLAETYDVCPGEDTPVTAADREGGCVPEVRIVEDRIVLGDVILFDFDSPRIRTRSQRLVRKIAEVILAAADVQSVSIEGHADAVGSDEYNRKLSLARAESTRAMLVSFGVPAERLLLVGHGKDRLRVQTARPHQGNRRVEFIVSRLREAKDTEEASAPMGLSAGRRGEP